MRAVVQKVSQAEVVIDGKVNGKIGKGLLVLIAVKESDSKEIAEWMINKILGLRVFPDDAGKMNLSVTDVEGSLLIVSNFTLYGDCRKGMRPSYSESASPAKAEPLYDMFVEMMRNSTQLQVETGVFGAMMDVNLINDGPVTLIIDKD